MGQKTYKEILEYRQKKAKPVVELFFKWAHELEDNGKMYKPLKNAITSSINQERKLKT